MRVVWAYRDYRKDKEGFFELGSKFEQELFYVSVASWAKYAPTFERVAYFDSSTLEELQQGCPKIFDYLSKVEIIDWKEKIDKLYPNQLFSAPKMWTYTQQVEPFFICDTDMILLEPLRTWFDPAENWGILYDFTTPSRMRETSGREEFLAILKNLDQSPVQRNFLDFTKSLNGGLVYFSRPETAQLVGLLTLTLGNQVIERNSAETWILYEEASIPSLVEYIDAKKMKCIPNRMYVEHPNVVDSKKQEDILTSIKRNLTNRIL